METVNVSRRMRECMRVVDGTLHVGEKQIPLRLFSEIRVVAVGKAAVPMAEHALQELRAHSSIHGVVVGTGPWTPPGGFAYHQGAHPVPDITSFAAGRALLESLRGAGQQTLVLFLISGGASSMAEWPLDETLPFNEVSEFYRLLLHSGLTIQNTNALRKHLSAIKGGRLALAAGAASRCTLLISDVPAGMLDVVGSGPSLADRSTIADCLNLLASTDTLRALPDSIKEFYARMPETPKVLPEGIVPSICFAALSSDSLLAAAEAFARTAGYRVVIDNNCDDWDYRDAAKYLFERMLAERGKGDAVCLLSAGEITVSIAGSAGQGGRNQQWALEMARLAAGYTGIAAMSVGSDGADGNSPAAGAVVDAHTWSRALEAQLDPDQALSTFDTFPLFARLGDAILVGPSGNNLRDLRVLLAEA